MKRNSKGQMVLAQRLKIEADALLEKQEKHFNPKPGRKQWINYVCEAYFMCFIFMNMSQTMAKKYFIFFMQNVALRYDSDWARGKHSRQLL